MTRASNPIHYRTDAERVAAARADGRCPVCGGFVRSAVGCLHTALKHMMSPEEYERRGVDKMNFDQLRDLRLELVNAAEANRPARGDTVRWHLGRGTDSLPQKGA